MSVTALRAASGSLVLSLMLLLPGCTSRPGTAGPQPAAETRGGVRFTDVTDAAGIRFRHTSGRSGRFLLPETLGSGCAFLDYNNDGELDLFLVNSTRLPGFTGAGPFYPALYRNDGNGRFTDVTRAAGLAVECYGIGVAVADYDADGFADIYVTALGPNHLFRNQGNGTFRDATKAAGVGDSRFSSAAAWFDFDRDGDLDLYVGNYCRWSLALNQVCRDSVGRKHLCGPSFYKGDPPSLYRNDGDGTGGGPGGRPIDVRFTDVAKAAGLNDPVGKVLGVVVWDADDDGWLDLVVAKDMEPNLLYRNNRNGTFTERGVEAGIAYSNQGKTRAGMGIDTGDTANTDRESILIGNNAAQGLAQYLADAAGAPGGHFTDVADQTGLYGPSLVVLTFGLAFVDYDLDGRKDIITANGHVDENIGVDGTVTFEQSLLPFRNVGEGKFQPVGDQLGPVFAEKRLWRGIAVGDYDADGDPDLLATACDGKPALLRNDGGNANAWLQVKAIGAGKNREAIGARVTVTAGGLRQTSWIRSGSSYCSQHELVAFFGLGSATEAETVEVRFPSGTRKAVQNVKARQRIVVDERTGLLAREAP